MKILIVHNTTYGNGEIVANTLGKAFEKGNDVTISHINNISPEDVAKDSPDAIVVGSFIRAFMLNGKTKGWLRSLQSSLKKANKTIKYGIGFLTHALPSEKTMSWRKRLNKKISKGNVITSVYPECLSGQVAAIEGPLKEGVVEELTAKGSEILKWMKK